MGFGAPSRLELENVSGGSGEGAGGTFETQAVLASLFLLKHESWFSDANFETLVPICSEQKNFALKKTKFEMGSLAFLVALLSICLSPHPPPPPNVGSLPKVDANFEENFLGGLPVAEVKEDTERHLSR